MFYLFYLSSFSLYFCNTGFENLGIIFEFSPWVLKICPEDGLKVGYKQYIYNVT